MSDLPKRIADALDALDSRGFVVDGDGEEHNDDEVFAAVKLLREEFAEAQAIIRASLTTAVGTADYQRRAAKFLGETE